jgi:hypothetical protein
MNMKRLIYFLILFSIQSPGFSNGPVKVEIKKEKGKFILIRGGEPYYIKGGAGFDHFDKLKEYGGNSIRIWSTRDAEKILDEAQSLGLTVTLGLFIQPERMGFDYNNEADVKKQLEELKYEILKFKDHPALLMWGVGNELELFATNMKVWDAVNEICKMIHELDPNHPTATMMAGVPERDIKYIKKNVPYLDMIAINAFKDLPYVPEKINATGWNRPYIISEWGPIGYWESSETPWRAFIEQTSDEKFAQCKRSYNLSVKKDSDRCLGSYVFIWGSKQERTHTLFSIFLQTGQETPMVDLMQYLWTGNWPQNMAPVIESLTIEGKKAKDNIVLQAGREYHAKATGYDPEKTSLIIKWALFKESNDPQNGGDGEQTPDYIDDSFIEVKDGELTFKAPQNKGPYRLFVYLFDQTYKVATANIPVFVHDVSSVK